MRNLRQRFGKIIVAGIIAGVLGGSTIYADMGGPNKNTCAFILGHLLKAPADSGAAAVFKALMIDFDCD